MENEMVGENINYCLEDIFTLEDIENRRIYLNCDIDSKAAEHAVYYILRYNRMDIGKQVEERKPITIYLNSKGGSVTAGFAIIDAMIHSKTPVHTVNLAECYSMGFLIFVAGEKRYAMPSSTYLCHDGSSYVYDSIGKLKDRMEFELGQMEERIKKYVVSRTNIAEKMYVKNYRKEWYFYPEEAKNLGVVTHIVGIDCDIDEIL